MLKAPIIQEFDNSDMDIEEEVDTWSQHRIPMNVISKIV